MEGVATPEAVDEVFKLGHGASDGSADAGGFHRPGCLSRHHASAASRTGRSEIPAVPAADQDGGCGMARTGRAGRGFYQVLAHSGATGAHVERELEVTNHDHRMGTSLTRRERHAPTDTGFYVFAAFAGMFAGVGSTSRSETCCLPRCSCWRHACCWALCVRSEPGVGCWWSRNLRARRWNCSAIWSLTAKTIPRADLRIIPGVSARDRGLLRRALLRQAVEEHP